MIAIIDYEMGNKYSVINALRYIGEDACVSSSATELQKADRLILPGVGAFGAAMDNLKKFGLIELIQEEVLEKKKPFLGICLGMQLLADEGEEKGLNQGLGLIPGRVVRLDKSLPRDLAAGARKIEEPVWATTPQAGEDQAAWTLKLPHIGWNDIEPNPRASLFKGLKKDKAFYFVHSYHYVLQDHADQAARCDYGGWFTAAIERGNIFATQFHPEKSQKNGLAVLKNFVNWEG